MSLKLDGRYFSTQGVEFFVHDDDEEEDVDEEVANATDADMG